MRLSMYVIIVAVFWTISAVIYQSAEGQTETKLRIPCLNGRGSRGNTKGFSPRLVRLRETCLGLRRAVHSLQGIINLDRGEFCA